MKITLSPLLFLLVSFVLMSTLSCEQTSLSETYKEATESPDLAIIHRQYELDTCEISWILGDSGLYEGSVCTNFGWLTAITTQDGKEFITWEPNGSQLNAFHPFASIYLSLDSKWDAGDSQLGLTTAQNDTIWDISIPQSSYILIYDEVNNNLISTNSGEWL